MLSAPCRRISVKDVFRTLIGGDVAADPERDDVRVLLRADVVLRALAV
jgi:hypothetical protein